MRTPSASLLLASAFLAINVIATGCSVKATFKQTTDTTSNVTGTTSGHAWWNEDGLLHPEHKAIAFVTMNQTNLQHDIAKGQGEYLTSLGALLGVPAQDRLAYGADVQARYALTQEPSQDTPAAWLTLLQDTAQPYRRMADTTPQH
ncbi:MAG: DUF3015 family protein [Nitrospira sp.]|jgi:hypothetical protein|nr:DUF3015 family protein [Nitrospira sp.]